MSRDWIAHHTLLSFVLFAVPLGAVIVGTTRYVAISLSYVALTTIVACAIGAVQRAGLFRAVSLMTAASIPAVLAVRIYFYPVAMRNSPAVFVQAMALFLLFVFTAIVIAIRSSYAAGASRR